MKILGVDFGTRNIGLSIAESPLAEPFSQLKYTSINKLISTLSKIVIDQQVTLIVIGYPDGSLRSQIKDFSKHLTQSTGVSTCFQDEAFSTKQATRKLIQAHASRKKRQQDHVAAATLILQSYLDEHPQS